MKVLAFIQVNNHQTQPSSIIVTWHARTNLIGSCRSLHMKNKPHWLSLIKQAYLSIVVKSECCIVFWLIIQYMQINSIIKIGQISSEALDQTIQFRYTRIPLKKQKPFIYMRERDGKPISPRFPWANNDRIQIFSWTNCLIFWGLCSSTRKPVLPPLQPLSNYCGTILSC